MKRTLACNTVVLLWLGFLIRYDFTEPYYKFFGLMTLLSLSSMLLIRPVFKALDWYEEPDVSDKSAAMLMLPAGIIAFLVTSLVSNIFPPGKSTMVNDGLLPSDKNSLNEFGREPQSVESPNSASDVDGKDLSVPPMDQIEPPQPGPRVFELPEEVVTQMQEAIAGLHDVAEVPSVENEVEVDWEEVRLQLLENIPDEEMRVATATWMLNVDQFMETMTRSDANWIDSTVDGQLLGMDLPDDLTLEQKAVLRKTLEMQAATVRMEGAPFAERMREYQKQKERELKERFGDDALEP